MKHEPDHQSKQGPGNRLRQQDEWDALERELRQPVPAPDEALCSRIMTEVHRRAPDPVRLKMRGLGDWLPRWGVVGAMGAAVVVATLIWVSPWTPGPETATQVGGTPPPSEAAHHPSPAEAPDPDAIRREQEFLVSDTRKIAAFLQENLEL